MTLNWNDLDTRKCCWRREKWIIYPDWEGKNCFLAMIAVPKSHCSVYACPNLPSIIPLSLSLSLSFSLNLSLSQSLSLYIYYVCISLSLSLSLSVCLSVCLSLFLSLSFSLSLPPLSLSLSVSLCLISSSSISPFQLSSVDGCRSLQMAGCYHHRALGPLHFQKNDFLAVLMATIFLTEVTLSLTASCVSVSLTGHGREVNLFVDVSASKFQWFETILFAYKRLDCKWVKVWCFAKRTHGPQAKTDEHGFFFYVALHKLAHHDSPSHVQGVTNPNPILRWQALMLVVHFKTTESWGGKSNELLFHQLQAMIRDHYHVRMPMTAKRLFSRCAHFLSLDLRTDLKDFSTNSVCQSTSVTELILQHDESLHISNLNCEKWTL